MTTRRNLHLHQYNHSNKSAVVILRSFVFGLAVYTCSHVVLFCSLSFSPKYASPVVVDNQPIPSVHRKLRHLLVDPLCFHDEPEVVNATVLVEQFESLKDSKLKQLINAPSLISWTRTTDKFFEEFNITAVLSSFLDIQKMHGWPNAEKIQVWSTTAHPYYIWDGNICFAAKRFAEAGSVKPHVLFTYLNENRGAFSRDVKHKTANWNHLSTHWSSWGCKDEEIYSYLNHKNTRAVITTQHQSIDHPKVWSIPLGVKEGRLPKKILEAIQEPRVNRTQLLMVNDNGWKHRKEVTETVLDNFALQNIKLTNTYQTQGNLQGYLNEMKRSKFILAPSGLGWDCYRIWEALYMGCIPIVERYGRSNDGWWRTLDKLPILIVEHFSKVTPQLLEDKYIEIASKAKEYNYEQLTIHWWAHMIRSFVPEDDSTAETIQLNQERREYSVPRTNSNAIFGSQDLLVSTR